LEKRQKGPPSKPASIAHLQNVHFLWRPFLRDPDDDMMLEYAAAGEELGQGFTL